MNKRRHQRIEVQNLVANLSDGVDTFSGTVNDLSRVGMLLIDIPQELNNQGETLSIIVSARGKDFKMLANQNGLVGITPKKNELSNSRRSFGAWTVFVINCEPTDEDIWASTTHRPDC